MNNVVDLGEVYKHRKSPLTFARRYKMKYKIIALFICTACIAYADTNNLFASGFNKYQQGLSELNSTLDSWSLPPPPSPPHVKSIPLEEIDAYQIFEDIWNPKKLLRLGDFGYIPNYNFFTHALIQNELRVSVSKDKETYTALLSGQLEPYEPHSNLTSFVIQDFRPRINTGNMKNTKIILLTDERRQLLVQFLGDTPTSNPVEARKKEEFLRQCVPIGGNHWNTDWILHSYPIVGNIVFNYTKTEALVFFCIGFEGGTAVYSKKNGSWELQNSKTTWIE